MRHRRFYVYSAIVLLAVFLWVTLSKSTVIGVETGYASANISGEWNQLIADSVNGEEELLCLVDGKSVGNNESALLYMDILPGEGTAMNRSWLIAAEALTDVLKCYVGYIPGERVCIRKGDQRLVIDVTDGSVVWNDEVMSGQTAKLIGDAWYLPVTVVEQAFGYSMEWFADQQQVSLNHVENADTRVYPSRYDYRLENRIGQIRDQGINGDCWAYAALSALESAMLPEKCVLYSADHMVLNNSYGLEHNSGGRYTIALAYLLAWQGPVPEESDTISPDCHIQEVQFLDYKDYNAIKEAVFLHGGVHTSIYMADMNSEYYNEENQAYCYVGTEKINHDVVIVGWDDNYPKENFNTELEGNGAFICQNSWGDGFGEDGCFYVSYYDSNIGIYNYVYTGIESADNYDNIYQSDLCGWIGQMGYGSETAHFANVYTAETDEVLSAVGFYALGSDTSYEVYVETGVKEYDHMSMSNLVAAGTFDNGGYYTVPLKEPMQLEAGEEFVIIVKITTPGEERPIAIEFVTEENPMSAAVDVSDGQGYISAKGNYWSSVEGTQNSNVCLKAYTTKLD